jgi:hypothetical protein
MVSETDGWIAGDGGTLISYEKIAVPVQSQLFLPTVTTGKLAPQAARKSLSRLSDDHQTIRPRSGIQHRFFRRTEPESHG